MDGRLITFCFFQTVERHDNAVFVGNVCFVFNGNIAFRIECNKRERSKFARFYAAFVSNADDIALGIFLSRSRERLSDEHIFYLYDKEQMNE